MNRLIFSEDCCDIVHRYEIIETEIENCAKHLERRGNVNT